MTALESVGFEVCHPLFDVRLGAACALAGQWDEALRLAEHALRAARERGQRGFEALALHLLGEIASRRDRPDADGAEDHYLRAMALAKELGMRPLIAHCRLGLAELSRAELRAL